MRAERGRQRAHDDLGHRAVDDLGERRARHPRDVLADAVEHDDRVVEREAENREQRRDRRRRHLPADEGVDARRDEDVVHQRDQHRDRVLPLEPQRDVDRDHQQRGDDRDQRGVGDRLAERRADRLDVRVVGSARTCRSSALLTAPTSFGAERVGRDLDDVLAELGVVDASGSSRRRGPATPSASRTSSTVAVRSSGAVIRVPDSKSMPKLRPLPAIASAPISRITPDIEKNHFDAPMKSKRDLVLGVRRRRARDLAAAGSASRAARG